MEYDQEDIVAIENILNDAFRKGGDVNGRVKDVESYNAGVMEGVYNTLYILGFHVDVDDDGRFTVS